jgi:hypothetical protein
MEVVLDKHSDEQIDERVTVTRYEPPVLVEMGTFGRDTLGSFGVAYEHISSKKGK